MPSSMAYFIGVGAGLLWYYIIPIRKRVAIENVRRAFGAQKTEKEIRKIVRGSFINLALNGVEFLRMPLLKKENLSQTIKFSGEEHFHHALEKRRGVITITAHFGNFDLLSCAYALRGYPVTVITKSLRNSTLNNFWHQQKEAMGLKIVPILQSFKPLLRALRNGEIAGIVIDQRPLPQYGIVVDFFGCPALTTYAPAVLAQRSAAAVLPVFIFRRGRFKHEVMFGKELNFERGSNSREEDIALNTCRYTAKVEEAIKKAPDHWLWAHRRWKMQEG